MAEPMTDSKTHSDPLIRLREAIERTRRKYADETPEKYPLTVLDYFSVLEAEALVEQVQTLEGELERRSMRAQGDRIHALEEQVQSYRSALEKIVSGDYSDRGNVQIAQKALDE